MAVGLLRGLEVAAGCGRLRHSAKTFGIADPQVVTREEAARHVTPRVRPIFTRLPLEHAVLLTRTS